MKSCLGIAHYTFIRDVATTSFMLSASRSPALELSRSGGIQSYPSAGSSTYVEALHAHSASRMASSAANVQPQGAMHSGSAAVNPEVIPPHIVPHEPSPHGGSQGVAAAELEPQHGTSLPSAQAAGTVGVGDAGGLAAMELDGAAAAATADGGDGHAAAAESGGVAGQGGVQAADGEEGGGGGDGGDGDGGEEDDGYVLLAVGEAVPAEMVRERWSSVDYTVHGELHRGHSSVVYKAVCAASGQLVAVKVYTMSDLQELQRLHLFREIKLHARLSHPSLIAFYAAFMEGGFVFLIEEFAGGGDLVNFLFAYGGKVPEAVFVKRIARPLFCAVQYMHAQGIMHRDVKPDNVLFTEAMEPKLADFGLAIDMREERPNSQAGTVDYMAPEVLACPLKRTPAQHKTDPSSAAYGPPVDVWALGALCYEMLVGGPPFKGPCEEATMNLIRMGAALQFPRLLSPEAKDLLEKALSRDPAARPSLDEMLSHQWLVAAESMATPRFTPYNAFDDDGGEDDDDMELDENGLPAILHDLAPDLLDGPPPALASGLRSSFSTMGSLGAGSSSIPKRFATTAVAVNTTGVAALGATASSSMPGMVVGPERERSRERSFGASAGGDGGGRPSAPLQLPGAP